MKRYSYFSAVFRCFFDANLYRDVAFRWKGKGYAYGAMLLAIAAIFLATILVLNIKTISPSYVSKTVSTALFGRDRHLNFEQGFNRMTQMLSQLPNLQFDNSGLISGDAQAVEIIDPTTNQPFLLIDTQSDAEFESAEDMPKTPYLVFKDRFINERSQVIYFSKILESGLLTEDFNLILAVLSQVPAIKLEDGVITLDEPQPYIITNPASNAPLIHIDASIETSNTLPENTPITLGKDAIYIKSPFSNEITTYILADLTVSSLTSLIEQMVTRFQSIFLWFSILFVVPIVFLLGLVIFAVILFTYAVIGKTMARYQGIETLDKNTLMRLAAVSFTPVLFIDTFAPNILPLQNFLHFILSLAYLYFAIGSTKQRDSDV